MVGNGEKFVIDLKAFTSPCRSELARDKPEGAAMLRIHRVIVDDHREQARSYRGGEAKEA